MQANNLGNFLIFFPGEHKYVRYPLQLKLVPLQGSPYDIK